jgi:hypothetical protein
MDLKALADLVRRMREAQRRYFAGRSTGDLEASKALERQVDAACREVLDPPQPGLFDRPPAADTRCRGYGAGATGPPCCDMPGAYNGYGSDGPILFECPRGCGCHD